MSKRDKFGAKTLPNLVRKQDLFFLKTWCENVKTWCENDTTSFIDAIKGKAAGLPEVLEIDGVMYRGEQVKDEVVKYFNKMGDPENERYKEGFWNDYENQCREMMEAALAHPDIQETRLTELSLNELKDIILSFPNNKAPDIDGVSHDMLKCLDDGNLEYILETMNKIIRHDNFSLPELLKSRFSLLHKGHGKFTLDINNYRRITVSQTIQRLFDRMLNKRGYIDKISKMIENSQYGFHFLKNIISLQIGQTVITLLYYVISVSYFDVEHNY